MMKSFWGAPENLKDVFHGEERPGDMTGDQIIKAIGDWGDRLVGDDAYRSRMFQRFPSLRDFFDRLKPLIESVASRGITIGGQVSHEVKILNNTLSGVLAGISVGLSDRGQAVLSSDSVSVIGNLVSVTVTVYAGQSSRHGIMVGNCQSLSLHNNEIGLLRRPSSAKFVTDGIVIAGIFGARILATNNYSSGFDFGLHIICKNQQFPSLKQWLLRDNYVPNKDGGSIKQEPRPVFTSVDNVP
jgi:hypothetical protein